MPLVAGVDCATQSTKVTVHDAASGAVVASGQAAHPDATEVDPEVWWRALGEAAAGVWDDVAAVAVAGQQHGMVLRDETGQVLRPALLWNDTRSAPDADALVAEAGGPAAWADRTGSVPVASFTATKLRWVAHAEPDTAARATSVCLPHDWVTWRLTGERAVTTDRGDASGTGYWSPAAGAYDDDLLALAFGRPLDVPRVLAPSEPAGKTAGGALVGAGTGDNMGAALGLDLRPGDAVVSLGTSGTAFVVSETPTADPSGAVAGFADATGRYLPLVCTLNAARVLGFAADLLGTDLAGVDRLATEAEPGAGGVTLLPYLDGERTPNLPDAAGTLTGLTRGAASPRNVARAAVEGMLHGLADGLDALRGLGVPVRRVLLVGGASRSAAVRSCAATVLGVPVHLPVDGEYVARGAARQAAWVLAGGDVPPAWPVEEEATLEPGNGGTALRAQYRQAREAVHPGAGS